MNEKQEEEYWSQEIKKMISEMETSFSDLSFKKDLVETDVDQDWLAEQITGLENNFVYYANRLFALCKLYLEGINRPFFFKSSCERWVHITKKGRQFSMVSTIRKLANTLATS